MKQKPTFIKFDSTFLSAVEFKNTEIVELDTPLQSAVTTYLYYNEANVIDTDANRQSLKADLEYAYNQMLGAVIPLYNETLKLTTDKTETRTKHSDNTWGNEETKAYFFEPVQPDGAGGGVQEETKTTGNYTTYDPDEADETETFTREQASDGLVKFYEKIKTEFVETYFYKFINIF